MLALQILNAAVTLSPSLDDDGYRRLAYTLRTVRANHWGSESLRRVAEALLGHLDAGSAVGFITLRAELPDLVQTLAQIQQAAEIENLPLGVRRLEEEGGALDLMTLLTAAQGEVKGREAGISPVSLAAKFASDLSSLMAGGGRAVSVADIPNLVEHYRNLQSQPGSIISLHPKLDALLRWNGLPVSAADGETALICARSGHGKTALGIHIALTVAAQGHPVDYDVIADASALQITERMVHHIAALPLKRTQSLDAEILPSGGRPAESIAERLNWAQGVLASLPISINDAPDMDQHELRMRLADKRARGVRLSIMENLDHCGWDQKESRMDRREYLGELVKITRQSDRQTGHHTFWLVQANRKTVENSDQIPMMENTQDSDLPKNHCTLFISIHNPNKAETGASNLSLQCRLPKNRQGDTDDFTLPYSIVSPRLKLPGVNP